jgi:transposase
MEPLSNDLRRRIIEAIQQNEETQPEIAERFSVGLSTVEKLWHRFRATGSYLPKPHAGGRERLLKDDEALIRAKVKAQADITLAELREKLATASAKQPVSLMTLSEELRRLKVPRKKADFCLRA